MLYVCMWRSLSPESYVNVSLNVALEKHAIVLRIIIRKVLEDAAFLKRCSHSGLEAKAVLTLVAPAFPQRFPNVTQMEFQITRVSARPHGSAADGDFYWPCRNQVIVRVRHCETRSLSLFWNMKVHDIMSESVCAARASNLTRENRPALNPSVPGNESKDLTFVQSAGESSRESLPRKLAYERLTSNRLQ